MPPSRPQRLLAGGKNEKNGNEQGKSHRTGTKRQRQNKGRESRKYRVDRPVVASAGAPNPALNFDPEQQRLLAEKSALMAKRASIKALHKRWEAEDEEKVVLLDEELVARHRQRCKDIGWLIFGFILQEAQVDAIYTIFYEKRDLLLLAKTGFRKSLIFQLLFFMLDPTGVVIILMPLKLLQAEQKAMINRIPSEKVIALTGENNHKPVQLNIATQPYTHVFTSPEIGLSKKFKKNVLDNPIFANRLSLLAIDEIYLVEEWGKSFRPLYAEIEKIRKRIPTHVPLFGVSATLTKSMRLRILAKAGFQDDYKLMQTSLDWPEIQQIHRCMQHSKASCLDLQFILPSTATDAKDIQKTIVFINSVSDIRPIIDTISGWMKQLSYPAVSARWIRPYYSAMSEWDKVFIAQNFQTKQEKNTECTIFVATDAYGMGIDNPDIKLVVQWDLPMSFNSMIQRMGCAGRKGGKSAFVFFTPSWTEVSGPEKVKNCMKNCTDAANANSQLSDSNWPKTAKPSPLGQEVDTGDLSDNESVADSDLDEYTDAATSQLFDMLM